MCPYQDCIYEYFYELVNCCFLLLFLCWIPLPDNLQFICAFPSGWPFVGLLKYLPAKAPMHIFELHFIIYQKFLFVFLLVIRTKNVFLTLGGCILTVLLHLVFNLILLWLNCRIPLASYYLNFCVVVLHKCSMCSWKKCKFPAYFAALLKWNSYLYPISSNG